MDPTTWTLRVVAAGQPPITVYPRSHRLEVGEPLTFDSAHPHLTALEHALGAIGADLAGTLQVLARRRRIALDNVEASVTGSLRNPLTFLEVVGEEGDPGIERVTVTMYVSSPAPEADLQALWQRALVLSPLACTFAQAGLLESTFVQV